LDTITPVVFVGYPDGRFDPKSLLPLARHGFTASPPSFDYDGKRMFVIDAPVIPGSSGSPVLLVDPHGFIDRAGNTVLPTSLVLGIVSEVLVERPDGKTEFMDMPTARNSRSEGAMPLNFGGVVKADCIVEAIEHARRTLRPR
jgi:hypothetical protein